MLRRGEGVAVHSVELEDGVERIGHVKVDDIGLIGLMFVYTISAVFASAEESISTL